MVDTSCECSARRDAPSCFVSSDFLLFSSPRRRQTFDIVLCDRRNVIFSVCGLTQHPRCKNHNTSFYNSGFTFVLVTQAHTPTHPLSDENRECNPHRLRGIEQTSSSLCVPDTAVLHYNQTNKNHTSLITER